MKKKKERKKITLNSRVIEQTHIIQNMLQFSTPRESFNNYRLISKSWKNAIENFRFNYYPEIEIFENELCEFQKGKVPIFYTKYLQTFKQFSFHVYEEKMSEKFDLLSEFILKNMKNLNLIAISNRHIMKENYENFLIQLLKNSQNTLQKLFFWCNTLFVLPNIMLPKLKKIVIIFDEHDLLSLTEFKILIQNILKNFKQIKIIEIQNIHTNLEICSFVAEHYSTRCISSTINEVLTLLPVQIGYDSISTLQNNPFHTWNIEYLGLEILDFNQPNLGNWEQYKEKLNFCPKLKGIFLYKLGPKFEEFEISLDGKNQDILPENKKIWNERIQYFKSKEIEILSQIDFDEKQTELHENVSWGFFFGIFE